MSYALYLDPSKKAAAPELPQNADPAVAYLKFYDCSDEQLAQFDPHAYPIADVTIAEIHAAQLEKLDVHVDRLSIVQQKSAFRDLAHLRERLQSTQVDITFNWDRRFSVDYYIKLLRYWIQCGIQHVSFYELTDFNKWQRLASMLKEHGFTFYDRYHACLPGCESPYQKHIAAFRDLYAIGGWSRVTGEDGLTRFKQPAKKTWEILAPGDQLAERLLFALADRDGIALADYPMLGAEKIGIVCQNGLARVDKGRLHPTDAGLWDTVGLVSHLHQNDAELKVS